MNLAGTANSQNVLGSLSSIASGGAGGGIGDLVSKFLPMVFGLQQDRITSAIGQQSGLGAASVTDLLQMGAPLVLAFLGKAQANGSLNASSLPSGLMSSLTSSADQTASAVASGTTAAAAVGPRWLVPLALLGALMLAWLIFRSLGAPKEVSQTAANATSSAPTAVGNAANSVWGSLGAMVAVKLPDGTSLNAPTLGMETRLVKYLDDGTVVVSNEQWFDFDRLLFDTGQAPLKPESQEQRSIVAAILKAYPKAKARIGGYTDNTGNAAANLALSKSRANNVVAELSKLGVDSSRLDAKGYGEEHPVADNATEEGRQKNRRIALHITEK